MTLECVQPSKCSMPFSTAGISLPSSRSAGEEPRCESPGPKRAEPQADATPVMNMGGPRSSRCGRPLKAAYRPSTGEKEEAYGMQPRRMQMRSSRGTGLLRRLLSERAPNGNGIPSPHLPLWSQALWLDWRPRDPHVESSFPNRFVLPEGITACRLLSVQKAEKGTLHRVCGLH